MDYLVVLGRIVTVIPLLVIMTLLMGKRHVGELRIFDFIIAVTIGAVAGADIADPAIRHGPTAFAIILLALLHMAVTYGILQNRTFAHLVSLEPIIVMKNGQILKSHMQRARLPLDTLLELLREKGVFNLNQVEFAIIEPDGKLSVLKKSKEQPVTPGDLNLPTQYKGMAIPLVVEGRVFEKGLQSAGLAETWLLEKLAGQGLNVQEVFFAELNSDGSLHISREEEPGTEQVFRF
jgi:uncharacterized membrane protein YcaP (DUF421 family)